MLLCACDIAAMRRSFVVLVTKFTLSMHVVFSALSTHTGSPGQATYVSSSAVLSSHSGWCLHVNLHTEPRALMRGVVDEVSVRWICFASADRLASPELTSGLDIW